MDSNDTVGEPALLTETQAADFLNNSVRTLQWWRGRKAGPAYVLVGRSVRYRRGDLLAWIEQNTKHPEPSAH